MTKQEYRQLLEQNAYLFYTHAERIMSDSRMRLTPVEPSEAGSPALTVGGLIDLWTGDPRYFTQTYHGWPALVVCVEPDPDAPERVSRVDYICPDGRHEFGRFASLMWQREMQQARERYAAEQATTDAFTIEQLISLLHE